MIAWKTQSTMRRAHPENRDGREADNLASCCNLDPLLCLTSANLRRMSRALANIGFANQHEPEMHYGYKLYGHEKLVRRSNGFRPIDSARPAHGSDLA